MKEEYHKHTGALKVHPMSRVHKDVDTQKSSQIEASVNKLGVKTIEKVVAKKKVEYMPMTSENQVMVKFKMSDLETIMRNLRNSGAQEIGVPLIPIKV